MMWRVNSVVLIGHVSGTICTYIYIYTYIDVEWS